MQSDCAVLFFCHGSRDPAWREPFDRLLADCRSRHPGRRVELCFLERMSPPLPEAIDALAADGVGSIRIVPLFLAPGSHTRSDLPAILAAASRRWPALRFEVRATLAEDPVIRAAMLDWAMAEAAPARHRGAPDDPLLLDSIGRLAAPGPSIAGRLLVSGSHGGRSAAEYVLERGERPRLVAFNDAGVGRAGAGIAALAMLDARAIACVAYGHDTAMIGDAADGLAHGVLTHCNRAAGALGLAAGQRLAAAIARLAGEPGSGNS